MSQDPEVDDILENLRDGKKKRKRVNSSRKGKKAERDLCGKFSERFGKPFVRDPDHFGSGSWSTINEDLKQDLDMESIAGDMITPHGFCFCMESKKGYDLETLNFFPGHLRKSDHRQLDEFIKQSERDAERVGRIPLVLYQKDRCPCIAFVPYGVIHPYLDCHSVYLCYKGYIGVSLDSLLELEDSFFFPE